MRNVRTFAVGLFEVILILIIACYANPEFATNYQYTSHQQIHSDSGNPIIYYKAIENLFNVQTLSKIQLFSESPSSVDFDLPSLKISAGEALLEVASRNAFYVFVSINAP